MIKIFNTPLLSFLCLAMLVGTFSSCDKDDDVENSGRVELLSFGPTGVSHGDTIRFIGRNLNKVTAIELTGASVAQAAFIQQSPELILIIVPEETERGLITLKTPDGDIISKANLDLEVPVKITSIPKQARPGENITLKGEYLNWVTRVEFEKGKIVDSFVKKSLTELVVKVPIDAQTGVLTIFTAGTEPLEIVTDSSLVVTLPAVTGLSPNPAERGKDLTITGTDLDLVKGVLFKGMKVPATSFVSQSATQLVIKVPDTANKGKVTLVAHSSLTVESSQSLLFLGDLPDLSPLSYAFYIDKLENGWQDWGWNRTADFVNTDNVRDGAASIKMNYTGQWGALKFASKSVSTASYSEITFAIFGTPGTGGKKINVTPSGGRAYVVTIEEGKWVEHKVPISSVGNPATITDLTFQNEAWTGIVYVDHVGLR